MIINSLELENFRNLNNLKLKFNNGINILYGDNAQGKTNILESIYLSGTTKSHRGSKDKDIINFNNEESYIRSVFIKNNIDYRIDMYLRKNKSKAIIINGSQINKASDLLGIVNIIFFSPEDLSIIKNGPGERRRFTDLELCQLDKVYLYNLSNYNKIINQRNILLKDIYFHPELIDTLDIWDNQLLLLGNKIIERRILFVKQLNEIIFDIHKKLSGNKENISIFYNPNVLIENYEKELKRNRSKDIKYKITSVGPHRDDLIFMIGNEDVKKYGSQGQQRTVALSLKLSEIELVKNITGNIPILLLDDVLSELDNSRQNYLLNSIGNIQTIITCTGLDELINNRINIDKIFKIVEGNIISEN